MVVPCTLGTGHRPAPVTHKPALGCLLSGPSWLCTSLEIPNASPQPPHYLSVLRSTRPCPPCDLPGSPRVVSYAFPPFLGADLSECFPPCGYPATTFPGIPGPPQSLSLSLSLSEWESSLPDTSPAVPGLSPAPSRQSPAQAFLGVPGPPRIVSLFPSGGPFSSLLCVPSSQFLAYLRTCFPLSSPEVSNSPPWQPLTRNLQRAAQLGTMITLFSGGDFDGIIIEST